MKTEQRRCVFLCQGFCVVKRGKGWTQRICLQGNIFIVFKIFRFTFFFPSLFIIPPKLFPVVSFKILPLPVSALLEESKEFCFKMQTVGSSVRKEKSANNGKERSKTPSGESQSCLCILGTLCLRIGGKGTIQNGWVGGKEKNHSTVMWLWLHTLPIIDLQN